MPTRLFSEEEKEEIRNRMLEAGFPLIKENGIKHMSIAKLTEAAGIGVGTFYRFWRNKEEYLTTLLQYQSGKVSSALLNGQRKIDREGMAVYLRAMVDENVSIYPYLTLEDEARLFQATEAFVPDQQKESAIVHDFLEMLEDARKDVNPGLIANLVKVLVLTAESREELHEGAYQETLQVQIETILEHLFQADQAEHK